jgi:hypothetical protein
MSSYSFTKLFSSITDSSIWCEDSDTRVVWVTMLAMADVNGEIQAAIPGLAKRSAVSLEKTEIALSKFLSPDPYSRDSDNKGVRIEVIQGGWRLLNYKKYRDLRNEIERKEYRKEWMRKNRREQDVNRCEQNVNSCEPKQKTEAEEEEDKEKKTETTKESSILKDASLSLPMQPPNSAPPPSTRKRSVETDADFWKKMKDIYPWVDMDKEIAKMKGWLLTPKGKGRMLTSKFVANWLGRVDKPLTISAVKSYQPITAEQVKRRLEMGI